MAPDADHSRAGHIRGDAGILELPLIAYIYKIMIPAGQGRKGCGIERLAELIPPRQAAHDIVSGALERPAGHIGNDQYSRLHKLKTKKRRRFRLLL